jgi:5'-3' exonuclease
MGIDRFYKSLNSQFPGIMNPWSFDTKLGYTYCFLDFNSIIYDVYFQIENEINILYESIFTKKTISEIILDKYNLKKSYTILNLSKINIKQYIITNVIIFIKKLILYCPKLKLLYIGVDGTVSFAKMLHSRHRRILGRSLNKCKELLNEYYKDELNKEPDNKNIFYNEYMYNLWINEHKFDKIEISPATEFMTELSIQIKNTKFGCNVLISDMDHYGEGEMKIIKYIKANLDSSKLSSSFNEILFYSPDADVILLSMLRYNYNIDVLRKENGLTSFNIINTPKLTSIILNIMGITDKKRIVDVIMIFTVFGNDFLPKLNGVDTNDILNYIKIYSSLIPKSDHFDKQNSSLFYNGYLNINFFIEFLKKINEFISNKKVKKQNKYLSPILRINKNSHNYYRHLQELEKLMNTYSNVEYYNYNYDKNELCETYIYGFQWLYNYYISGDEEYLLWNYHYHSPPDLDHLIKYLNDYNNKNDFKSHYKTYIEPFYIDKKKKYFSSVEALLFVTGYDIINIISNDLKNNYIKLYQSKILQECDITDKIKINKKNGKINIHELFECNNSRYFNNCNELLNNKCIDIYKSTQFLKHIRT